MVVKKSPIQESPAFLSESGGSVLISVVVQPRSSTNELRYFIAGTRAPAIKIKLTSAPVDGQANKSLIAFLSKTFKIKKSAITIKQGATGRKKLIQIDGIGLEQATALILEKVPCELKDNK